MTDEEYHQYLDRLNASFDIKADNSSMLIAHVAYWRNKDMNELIGKGFNKAIDRYLAEQGLMPRLVAFQTALLLGVYDLDDPKVWDGTYVSEYY